MGLVLLLATTLEAGGLETQGPCPAERFRHRSIVFSRALCPCRAVPVLVTALCVWAGHLHGHASTCGCQRLCWGWQGLCSGTSPVLPQGPLWCWFLTLFFLPFLPFRCCIQVSAHFPQPVLCVFIHLFAEGMSLWGWGSPSGAGASPGKAACRCELWVGVCTVSFPSEGCLMAAHEQVPSSGSGAPGFFSCSHPSGPCSLPLP